MYSTSPANLQWEIWMFGPNGWRAPVDECGSFGSCEDAERMGSRLRDWLHLGVQHENLLDNAADEYDRVSLLTMREFLHQSRIDPAAVTVAAVRRGAVSDNAVTCPDVRADAGHAVRGPFGAVDVRARRQ